MKSLKNYYKTLINKLELDPSKKLIIRYLKDNKLEDIEYNAEDGINILYCLNCGFPAVNGVSLSCPSTCPYYKYSYILSFGGVYTIE